MLDLIFSEVLELFQLICVITLASYFIIRTDVFNRLILEKGSIKDKLLIILFFGILSIYGTMSNIILDGSPANVRDLGPVIAGLCFGPWIGLGSAIIGALFRFSLGGITVIPCTLTTIIAGILAGIVWKINKKQYIGTYYAVIFIFLIELLHLGLILLLAGNGPEVREIIENMWTIMVPLYFIGISIFSIVYKNYITEKKTHEELEREKIELQFAQEIQESFLPKGAPSIIGYDISACAYPAREVGGDFYDFILLKDGGVGFVIADVSGKSVPAALFMALSCTIIRVSAGWIRSPGQVAEEVNTLITLYAESGMFFSMVYGIISPRDDCITYINAGHPPPVFFRSDGSFNELHLTGTIIGFMEDQKFKEADVCLEKGDLIVCYTDGVTEAQCFSGERFGKARLYQVIDENKSKNAEDIIRSIIVEINRFVGKYPQFDDITLLVIKRDA